MFIIWGFLLSFVLFMQICSAYICYYTINDPSKLYFIPNTELKVLQKSLNKQIDEKGRTMFEIIAIIVVTMPFHLICLMIVSFIDYAKNIFN